MDQVTKLVLIKIKKAIALILENYLGLKKKESISVPVGFIAQSKNKAYVIFRGTKTTKEWVNNVSINLKDYFVPNYGNVHDGFFQIYNSARNDLLKLMKEIHSRKIFVAGHSLGGALATLSLPDIELNMSQKVAALYTFGSPRVGDNAFAKAFNDRFQDKSFRIANTSDIVTAIPLPIPMGAFLGGYFSHIDTPIDFTCQNNEIELNHVMKTYLAQLNEARKKNGIIYKIMKMGRLTHAST